MIIRLAAIILLALIPLGAAAPVFAQGGPGTISGQVVNHTPGGGSVAGLEVNLITYQNGSPHADTPATQTDAEGRFSFAGLEVGPEYGYDTVVSFQGVNYWSDLPEGQLPAFENGETTLDIIIPVYDTTGDSSAVLLMLSHVIIAVQGDTLEVREYYVFGTTDNRTFTGREGDPGALHFSLPTGAAELVVNYGPSSSQIIRGEDGFWDPRPVNPSGNEVGYSYTLALNSGRADLTRVIDYMTARLDVVVTAGSLEVSGDRLVPDESMTISGALYDHYFAENIPPGQPIAIQVSGPPGGPGAIWLLLVGAVVVAAALVALYMVRRRRPAPAAAAVGDASRQQQLIAELAALDDHFEAGDIDEGTYRKLRDEKKQELVRLMREHPVE